MGYAQDTTGSNLTCFACNSRYHANCTDGEALEEWQEKVEEEDEGGSRMRKGWLRCGADQDVCFLLENG